MDTYIWVVCGSKNRHQKDMWFKEIGLRTQILLIVLGSMVNVTVREGRSLYYHLMSMRIFTLIMNKISREFQILAGKCLQARFGYTSQGTHSKKWFL
jgi:hypothetical protein